jgi:hypothetical protein
MKEFVLNGEKYIRDVERFMCLSDVCEWYEGDSVELEKWIGFGFFEHIFVSENGKVVLYYCEREGEKFHEILKETLTSEFFDRLCRKFFELIRYKDNDKCIKCWPIMTIFHEISLYPDFVSNDDLRRLIRVRGATESFFYDFKSGGDIEKGPLNYVFYRGQVFEGNILEFLSKSHNTFESYY